MDRFWELRCVNGLPSVLDVVPRRLGRVIPEAPAVTEGEIMGIFGRKVFCRDNQSDSTGLIMANIDQPRWNGLGVALFSLSAIAILVKALASRAVMDPWLYELFNEVIEIIIERVWSKPCI